MHKKNFLNFLCPIFKTDWLVQATGQNIILPFYHTISDIALPHIQHLYHVRDVQSFVNDLDFFCKNYESVSIKELYKIISNKEHIKKPIFHLTFDDGLKELYTTIAPILEERKIPATIFVNTSFIDNKDLFYRYKVSLIIDALKKNMHIVPTSLKAKSASDAIKKLLQLKYSDTKLIDNIAKELQIDFEKFLEDHKPYLTVAQIKDLQKRGFSIGSHSNDHPFFADINNNDKQNQFINSFRILEEQFDIQDRYFSFPFSDVGVNMDFFKWIFEEQHCKLSFGTSGLKKDCFKYSLQRISIDGNSQSAKQIIKTSYFYFISKAIFNKNRIRR